MFSTLRLDLSYDHYFSRGKTNNLSTWSFIEKDIISPLRFTSDPLSRQINELKEITAKKKCYQKGRDATHFAVMKLKMESKVRIP